MSKLYPYRLVSSIEESALVELIGVLRSAMLAVHSSALGRLFLVCRRLERTLGQGLQRMNIVMRVKIELDTTDLSEYQEVCLFVCFGMSLMVERPMDPFCISW